MSWLKILIFRHALSEGNKNQRMMGHLNDELTSEGLKQIAKLAQYLSWNKDIPTAMYSSPLLRASRTAQLLLITFFKAINDSSKTSVIDSLDQVEKVLKTLPVQIQYCEDLKEFQNGIFQGLTWSEAMYQYPNLCHQLESSIDWTPIPGAESLMNGRTRASRFIRKLLKEHTNGDCVWVMSHEWLIQHLIAELLGCDRTWALSIENTSVFEFWLDRKRWFTSGQNRWNSTLWQVRRFNDISHLSTIE